MLRAEFKIKEGVSKSASVAMVTSYIVDGIAKDAMIYRATDMPGALVFKVVDYDSDEKPGDGWSPAGRIDINSRIYNQILFYKSATIAVELEKDYSFSIEIKSN